MKLNTILSITLISILFPFNAQSAILAFNFEGSVNRIFATGGEENPIPPDFAIGLEDVFTATVLIDTTSPEILSSSPTETLYRFLNQPGETQINGSINGLNTTTNKAFLRITNNGTNNYDQFGVTSLGLSGATTNGLNWNSLAIIITDTDGTVFTDTSIPNAVPDPSEIESISFSLFFTNESNITIAQVSGFGTGSYTVVPLPPAVLLLGSSLFGLLAYRKN